MACAAPAIGARVHADAETGFHLGARTLRFGAVESTVHRCLPPLAARRLLPARQSPASRDEGGSAATEPRILAPNKATSPQKTRVGGSRGCPWGRSSRRRFRTRESATGCHRYGYKTVLGRRRWLSRDPIGERGGLNLYKFAGNNAIEKIELFGLEVLDDGVTELEAQRALVFKICKTSSEVANIGLEFLPQSDFSEIVLGEKLSGEKVSGGQRALGAGLYFGGGWLVERIGKLAIVCCKTKKTVCLYFKIQRHHLIPKTRFANHPLVMAANVDIYKDARNIIDLANHDGYHTNEYMEYVQGVLDEAFNLVDHGAMTPEQGFAGACKIIREGIIDGSAPPLYNIKKVFPVPDP